MRVIRTVSEMRDAAGRARSEGRHLALVPTMGSLHTGHLKLVEEARNHADHITVSVYVNPTQFGPTEDFKRYPRDLDKDLSALESIGGVDVVYAPEDREMYPEGDVTFVTVEKLGTHLCGDSRPGHFRGVTTVVSRLFIHCMPHIGVFGLKDAQQFFILRRMTKDLGFDMRLVGVPTVREDDGLAMSSRNAYLSAEERCQSVVLSRAVTIAQRLILEGEQHPQAIVINMLKTLESVPLARVQYASVVDTDTLQPLNRITSGQEVLAAVAVFFGQTRLIDNSITRSPAAG